MAHLSIQNIAERFRISEQAVQSLIDQRVIAKTGGGIDHRTVDNLVRSASFLMRLKEIRRNDSEAQVAADRQLDQHEEKRRQLHLELTVAKASQDWMEVASILESLLELQTK